MSVLKRKLAKGMRWRYDVQVGGVRMVSPAIYLSREAAKRAEADACGRR